MKHLGQHEILRLNGRNHFDLPAERARLPRPGETEWDMWAKHEQRKHRVAEHKNGLIKNLNEPLDNP